LSDLVPSPWFSLDTALASIVAIPGAIVGSSVKV